MTQHPVLGRPQQGISTALHTKSRIPSETGKDYHSRSTTESYLNENEESCESCDFCQNNPKLRNKVASIFGKGLFRGRDRRILLKKVADSARKAVKLAEPYKPYGGQFLEFCSIFLSTYQTCMKLTRKSTLLQLIARCLTTQHGLTGGRNKIASQAGNGWPRSCSPSFLRLHRLRGILVVSGVLNQAAR